MLRCITYYFNPKNSEKIRQDFINFKDSFNAPLTVVEAAYPGQSFWIEDSIRISADESNMLWQPERLINIGIQSLKNTVDQVAWFDPTIIFEDMSWYKKTQTALDSNIICQLFSDVNDEKGYLAKAESPTYDFRQTDIVSEPGRYDLAWAAKREYIPHGIYDFSVVGNNSLLQILTWQGAWNNAHCNTFVPEIAVPILTRPMQDFLLVKNHLFYLRNTKITTTSTARPVYTYILNDFLFNVDEDIQIGSNGLWQWASDKPGLHQEVKDIL